MMKNAGITTIEIIFCTLPEVFFFGNQSSKLKNLQIKVKKLIAKTGRVKMDFKFLLFDLNASKRTEVKTARNDEKSPYHAKATLDKMEVTKIIKKVWVLFLSGVLKSKSKE